MAEAGRYGVGMTVPMSAPPRHAGSSRSQRLRRQHCLVAGCGGDSTDAAATTDTVATTTATSHRPLRRRPSAGPTTIAIVVKNAAPEGGIKRATVAKGDDVVLVVHSDVDDEVHLHGYNLSTDVAAGGVGRIRLRRQRAGPVRGRARAARRQDRRPHRHPVSAPQPGAENATAPRFRLRQQVVGEA